MLEDWKKAKNLKELLNMVPDAKAVKRDLEDYFIILSREYTKERARDVFSPYVILMVSIAAVAFASGFSWGYMMLGDQIIPKLQSQSDNSTSSGSDGTSVKTDTPNRLQFALILGTSAAAAAAIALAAIGGNAIQRQTDRLSALTYAMDDISDRISSKELDDASTNSSKRKTGDQGSGGQEIKKPSARQDQSEDATRFTRESFDHL